MTSGVFPQGPSSRIGTLPWGRLTPTDPVSLAFAAPDARTP